MQNVKPVIFSIYSNLKPPFHLRTLPLESRSINKSGSSVDSMLTKPEALDFRPQSYYLHNKYRRAIKLLTFY